jgi:hypothetical protein
MFVIYCCQIRVVTERKKLLASRRGSSGKETSAVPPLLVIAPQSVLQFLKVVHSRPDDSNQLLRINLVVNAGIDFTGFCGD